jgi:hypothetical protein
MMKRISILIAVLFAASTANAATFALNTDKASYLVGESITVTLTATVAGGGEQVLPFSSYGTTIGWNSAVAFVKNTGMPNAFGNSNQTPLIAGLNGAANTPCANTGNTCTLISQVNSSFAPVNVAGGTVVTGTLVLEADALGLLNLSIASFSNLGATDGSAVVFGTNAQVAEVVVPEPTTAALLGLGLLGLSVAGRRRPVAS